MATTVRDYPHHAYALGARCCDLASAAGHAQTDDFIRRTELDKPSQLGPRQQTLVLFYGLDIEETVILGLRQILVRLIRRGAGTDVWRIAFGRTVHHILAKTAPSIPARLEMFSCLKADAATSKELINRATALAGRFDDRDHDRPAGIGFDYAYGSTATGTLPSGIVCRRAQSSTARSDRRSFPTQSSPSCCPLAAAGARR